MHFNHRGTNPQPKHVLWMGIKPGTFSALEDSQPTELHWAERFAHILKTFIQSVLMKGIDLWFSFLACFEYQ